MSNPLSRAASIPRAGRSINRDRQDNTFAKATLLGTLRASQSVSIFQARGSIGKSDPVDVYRLNVAPNAASSGSVDTFRVKKGSVRISTYYDFGTGLQLLAQTRFGKGTQIVPSAGFAPVGIPVTLYLVFDRPTQNTSYSYTSIFQP